MGLDGSVKQTNEAGIDITPLPGFVIKTKRIDEVRVCVCACVRVCVCMRVMGVLKED